jgi:septum site-determining protein MinD
VSKIVSIHSFRGGTGKSNLSANVATLLAVDGKRVGVIDTDIQSPGIHVLFGLKIADVQHSLNDYLWGQCSIEQAAHDVTPLLVKQNNDRPLSAHGQIFLIPSSMEPGEIGRILREGCNVDILRDGLRKVVKALDLDVLVIDTHPGLNEETLVSIAFSDVLGIVMRPDEQDYQGTHVTVELARKLGVKRMMLIVNKNPKIFAPADVKAQCEQIYRCEVAAILPHSEDMLNLASGGIFSLKHPDHPITQAYRDIATQLVQ